MTDYVAASKLSIASLSSEAFTEISERSGFVYVSESEWPFPFLTRKYIVFFSDFFFNDFNQPEKEIPIQEQVLILHDMQGGKESVSGVNWIAYREIPGASFYFNSFVKRAVDPFKKVFGSNAQSLNNVSGFLSGATIKEGNAGFEIILLPKAPLRLILWDSDDEFLPKTTIFVLQTFSSILSPEDVAWLSGMLVYRWFSLSYQ